jgi:hypothetical protein
MRAAGLGCALASCWSAIRLFQPACPSTDLMVDPPFRNTLELAEAFDDSDAAVCDSAANRRRANSENPRGLLNRIGERRRVVAPALALHRFTCDGRIFLAPLRAASGFRHKGSVRSRPHARPIGRLGGRPRKLIGVAVRGL